MSILIKWLSRALFSFFLIASAVGIVSYHLASRSLPKYNQTLISDKIDKNIEIHLIKNQLCITQNRFMNHHGFFCLFTFKKASNVCRISYDIFFYHIIEN